ncbi:XrtA-associated tyrosine autokinase [Candidatus Moduliflexota bacterium]
MSRIEDALEKANRQRTEAPKSVVPDAKGPGSPMIQHGGGKEHVLIENPYLVMLNGQQSPVAEEFKKLKSMVVKLTQMERFRNTLMVTSAVKAEGKSITAINLALTLAQEYDNTVLLVDADFRGPSVHKYLGMESSPGLSDCLVNGTDISKALVRTSAGKLVVLPAGKTVKNPVELLMSDKMKGVVKELKQRYADRYVIFDTPPVLPFAEVHSLASLMDGVVFVVREGCAPMSDVKEAIEMLKDAPVLGSVFNCASIENFGGYGYYYGYNQYSYGAGKAGR